MYYRQLLSVKELFGMKEVEVWSTKQRWWNYYDTPCLSLQVLFVALL